MLWSDFNNLSAAQQTKAAQFATIGNALAPNKPDPDISAVTYSQAKAALIILRDIQTLIEPSVRGILYVIRKGKEDAAKAFDTSNP